MKRISKSKLIEYNRDLSERDKAVLRSVKICKFIKTDQAGRLHFGGAASPSAALRAVTRTLTKLHGMGLIQPLRRRIGGVRAGSTSYVWTLKAAGAELLRLGESAPPLKHRRRVFEPTYIFLKHTLAVSELYTRLRTTTNLIRAEFEPSCWRGYTTAFGVNVTIKPDLYAITTADGYEDHWFFEVDLDTEAPSRIMRKCEVYGRYCLTGNEQKLSGLFPQVVWIVPDEKRKQTLQRHIRENLSEYADLFVVITFDDLDALIRAGEMPVIGLRQVEDEYSLSVDKSGKDFDYER